MKNQIILKKFVVGLCLFGFFNLFGQRISETQWFFGNSSFNLQIDKNGDIMYLEERMAQPFGIGGSAVINDHLTGNLLFYSDGNRVYDASHQLLSGTLSGNPAINQSAVACPAPGSLNDYYIFTNSGSAGVNSIQYTVVDSRQVGNGNGAAPLGEIESENNPTLLLNPSEGMIIIPGRGNVYYWLISQNRITFDYAITRIDASGIQDPQYVSLDSLDRPGFEAAAFSFNPDSALLAIAPKTPNRNVLIANFDIETGNLSFNQSIRNSGFEDSQNENIYDVEWSPDGSKLYISRFGSSDRDGNLYQFDFNDSTRNLNSILPNTVFRSLGLKTAIDNKLYHLFQNNQGDPFQIAVVNTPDVEGDSLDYETPLFEEDFNANQFPAFSPEPFFRFDTLSFTWLDSCQNDATKFFPVVSPTPTNYFWDFGIATSTNVAPIVTYDQPASLPVSLTVSLNGIDSTINLFVNILPNDVQLNVTDQEGRNVPQDTVICIDETLRLTAEIDPQGAAFYVWSDGTIGPILDVDTTGSYWVEATLPTGCSIVSTFNVTEYGIQSQVANQWYFGENAGIDFNQPVSAITGTNAMFSPEGCASISNRNGDVLFYTNGVSVWNRDDEIMSGGTNIGGDSTASQGVLILPFSDDETMFYIFTAQEVYDQDLSSDMTYSIVDMKKDNARGAVILKNLPLFQNSLEKVIATGFEGTKFLVTHEFGNNSFRTNFINEDGIGRNVFSPIGTVILTTEEEQADGYMKFLPGAVNFVNILPATRQAELFDFIDTVGGFRMSNPRIIETNEINDLYGLGFSNDGTEMYISTADGMIGFQLDSLGTENEIAEIEASKSNVSGTGYGAVQRGPDGQVYFAIDNSQNLGVVTSDQDGDVQVNEIAPPALDPDGVGRISRIGLPNFTQSVGVLASEPGYAVENACLGQDVLFQASGTSIIDEYNWYFGDNALPPVSSAIGSADSVNVRYDTTGIFAFELQITNRCAREREYPGDPVNPSRLPPLPPPFSIDTTFFDEVEVFRTPGLPTIPDDTSLCNGPILLEAWPVDSAGLLYYWSTGDTTRTINVLEPDPRIIQTAITTLEGCTSDTLEVFIGDGRPQIDLGPDQAYCQFETIPDLDAQNVQVFYDWRIDEEPANDTRFQQVNSDSIGTFVYSILVREPRNNCEGSDTVAITIRESPNVTSTFTPPSTCGAGDASFEFTIENSGSFLYSLLNPDTTVNAAVDGPVTAPAIDSLSIGAYNFFVENIVTGCRYTEPLFVEDDVPFDLFASNLPDCDTEASIQIGLSGTALPERTNVYVTNLSQDTVFTQRNLVPPLTISPVLDSGLYFVNVEDVSNGCFQVDSVLVRQLVANPEDCRPFIIAPNAFSPNGNSQNEEFYIIPNPFIDQFEIYIYTRWGELVYYSDQKNFRWDGKYQNKYLPVGTYAYVIRYTSLESEFEGEQVQYGSVTLVR